MTPTFDGNVADTSPTIARTPHPALWANVPEAQCDGWRWQLANRLDTVAEVGQLINLTPEEIGNGQWQQFHLDTWLDASGPARAANHGRSSASQTASGEDA
ncbi:MAG: hypothetical protein GYB65_08340 [Chloroflexi bacterium]|nr:hypothetical protein [Chloroflexota bacterium]